MNAKKTVCALAVVGIIVIAFITQAGNPGPNAQITSMLGLFKGGGREAAHNRFKKLVPTEKRQDMLFLLWAASDDEPDGNTIKGNIIRYLASEEQAFQIWQPTTWLMIYSATNSNDPDNRLVAIDLIAKKPDEGARDILWAQLGDKDDRIRLRAVQALGQMNGADVVLSDFVKVNQNERAKAPSVTQAKEMLQSICISAKEMVTHSSQSTNCARKLVEDQKDKPLLELSDWQRGERIIAELPEGERTSCLCEAWIMSAQFGTKEDNVVLKRWILGYFYPITTPTQNIEKAWSSRLAALICAATKDANFEISGYAKKVVISRVSRAFVLSLVYDDEASVALTALNTLRVNYGKDKGFVNAIYDAYLLHNSGNEKRKLMFNEVKRYQTMLQSREP